MICLLGNCSVFTLDLPPPCLAMPTFCEWLTQQPLPEEAGQDPPEADLFLPARHHPLKHRPSLQPCTHCWPHRLQSWVSERLTTSPGVIQASRALLPAPASTSHWQAAEAAAIYCDPREMRDGGREVLLVVTLSAVWSQPLPPATSSRTPATHRSTPISAANAKGDGRYIESIHARLSSCDACSWVVRTLAAASLRRSNVWLHSDLERGRAVQR